jgi:hypothetical protein
MPKKNDNIVGSPEGPIVGGGHQTADQAVIVQQGSGSRTDRDRRSDWSASGSPEARRTPAVGGSSQGRSDQQAARGPNEDRKVAGGLYDSERTHGAKAEESRDQRSDAHPQIARLEEARRPRGPQGDAS